MSKSKKNGVNPETIISSYGADTARLFMLSDSPPEKNLEWKDEGLEGSYRYINKIYKFFNENTDKLQNTSEFDIESLAGFEKDLFKATHKVIKQISEDIESFGFNKAVAHLREFSNLLLEAKFASKAEIAVIKFAAESFAKLLMPFAPFLAETIWEILGLDGLVASANWPEYQEQYLVESEVVIAVQINGKMRTTFTIEVDASKDEYEKQVLSLPEVQKRIANQSVKKMIVVPKKIVNVIV